MGKDVVAMSRETLESIKAASFAAGVEAAAKWLESRRGVIVGDALPRAIRALARGGTAPDTTGGTARCDACGGEGQGIKRAGHNAVRLGSCAKCSGTGRARCGTASGGGE